MLDFEPFETLAYFSTLEINEYEIFKLYQLIIDKGHISSYGTEFEKKFKLLVKCGKLKDKRNNIT